MFGKRRHFFTPRQIFIPIKFITFALHFNQVALVVVKFIPKFVVFIKNNFAGILKDVVHEPLLVFDVMQDGKNYHGVEGIDFMIVSKPSEVHALQVLVEDINSVLRVRRESLCTANAFAHYALHFKIDADNFFRTERSNLREEPAAVATQVDDSFSVKIKVHHKHCHAVKIVAFTAAARSFFGLSVGEIIYAHVVIIVNRRRNFLVIITSLDNVFAGQSFGKIFLIIEQIVILIQISPTSVGKI